MWPGLEKSSGVEVGDARARAVRLRSCAEIPVEVPINGSDKMRAKRGSALVGNRYAPCL